MYSHTTVGANNVAEAKAFYDAVLAPLGLEARVLLEEAVGYGPVGGKPQFWVMRPFDGGKSSAGNGSTIGLLASKRATVDACHSVAIAQGGKNEGAPGPRPDHHPDYYGAYFRDLDGNKICVCSHHAE